MKISIRRGVFETNSSSMHSLTWRKGGSLKPSVLTINENNRVTVHPDEFGWGIERYDDQYTKLAYLVMQAVETCREDIKSEEDLAKTPDIIRINDEIAKYCNCDGIELREFKFEVHSYESNGKPVYYTEHEGYIDHQSVEGVNSCISETNNSIIEYIFDDSHELLIANDNM